MGVGAGLGAGVGVVPCAGVVAALLSGGAPLPADGPPGVGVECSVISSSFLLPRPTAPSPVIPPVIASPPHCADGIHLVCTKRVPAVCGSLPTPRHHLRGRSVGFHGVSTSVVLVPGAPVVVPELSGAAAEESSVQVIQVTDMLRAASAGAERVVVWGSAPPSRRFGDVRSSLRRWGAAIPVGRECSSIAEGEDFPDSALLGWWFLDRAGVELPRSFVGVHSPSDVHPLPGSDTLVVVVADGPASLDARAPIREDPRGVELDFRISSWLDTGGDMPDPSAQVADQVGWCSRATWLALADLVGDRAPVAAVSWAPFGVGYHGARWTVPFPNIQGDES